ncbi:MAG TPA: hypothetical protein VG387_06735 [Rhizomicrobium sp.]|jgi:hypothetical protein|nr:hypothetical protein [Rhizomicrobium sp.]
MSIAPITVDPVRQPAAAATAAAQATLPAASPTASNDDSDGGGDFGGISFHDVLDAINPLQHLPVIGTLYRDLTGEQIKPFPKAAGDLLYGGPLGFVGSIADTVFEKITGKDFGATVFDTIKEAFNGGGDVKDVASNDAPAAPADATPVRVASAPVDTTAAPVASDAPALPAPANVTAASLNTIVVPGQDALLSALSAHGIDPAIAQRAANAYARAVNVAPANDTLPAPALRASIAE